MIIASGRKGVKDLITSPPMSPSPYKARRRRGGEIAKRGLRPLFN